MTDIYTKKEPSLVILPDEFKKDIEKAPNTDRQYLGQPDVTQLKDEQTLYSVYPKGHGAGEIILQKSTDFGETWTEMTDTPFSWKESLETPTLYTLNRRNGDETLILISGSPNWHGNKEGGWQTSLSFDNGKTWSEFKRHHSKIESEVNWTTVAMSSLIQLRDSHGEYIEKWMGIYHNPNFINYKSILSFDENGNERWSKPEPFLSEYRDIEKSMQICEIGLLRSPDEKSIVALARTQSHQHRSVLFFSSDEGKTWSEPKETLPELHGERHKAVYDPVTGRLIITFREIRMWEEAGKLEWKAGNWLAWVGTYENLINCQSGAYRICLSTDYTQSPKSGDTGYAGVAVKSDGTLVMHSYGHWDEAFSKKWEGPVTEDLCYIIQAKFKLEQMDKLVN